MTNTAPKNVVSITDYQKSALSKNEVSNVLEDCRDLALARLNRTLTAMLDKIDDDLNDLAEKAIGLDEQHAYLNARKEAQFKRTAIEAAFRKQFTTLFKEKANRADEAKPSSDPFAASELELSLVDDKEVEEDIAISKMATALQDNCESELQLLAARIGFLLDSPDLDLKANPVSPEVIHNTFKAACQQIEAGFTVKLAIMRLFDHYLAKDLPAIYKEINSRLVSRQILPEIRPGYRGKPRPSGGTRTASGQNITQGAAQSAGQGTHPGNAQTGSDVGGEADSRMSGSDNPQEIFTLLQQLLNRSSQPLSAAFNSGQMMPGGSAAQGDSGTAYKQQPLTAGFFDTLNKLQRGDASLLPGSETPVVADTLVLGHTNLLHEIRNSSLAAGVGQLDGITIDIVAMLFDYIFDDPDIPEAMKGLIGRLQIPVLKVAMLDKKLFSSKSHPTRKLLDALGAAAIGRGQQFSAEDPLYRETERIAQRIVNEFESDVAIFDNLLGDLETFLAREEKITDAVIEQSAKFIHDRERLEIARVVAEEEVRQRTEGMTTITLIRNFLRNSWVLVLTNAHATAGEDSDTWIDAVKAMDELLWSVKPKMTAEDRKHLVTRLPILLKRLHTGMAAISMDEAEQKQFFANLVACHTRAVKAGLGGDSNVTGASNPELSWTVADQQKPLNTSSDTIMDAVNEANAESALIRKNVADGSMQIEEVTLANESEPKLYNSQDHRLAKVMASLKRGSWVDFKQGDGSYLRYKLSWVSPLKKIYLFTSLSNQKAVSVSPQAMEAQLMAGTAVLLEDTPLMDRAVENMLENLQAKS